MGVVLCKKPPCGGISEKYIGRRRSRDLHRRYPLDKTSINFLVVGAHFVLNTLIVLETEHLGIRAYSTYHIKYHFTGIFDKDFLEVG